MRSPAGGEIGEAPPVADEASRFRGSAPIGGHDSARQSVGTTVGKRAPPLRTAKAPGLPARRSPYPNIKSLAEFAARRRQKIGIIFHRDMRVGKNTSQTASVEFLRRAQKLCAQQAAIFLAEKSKIFRQVFYHFIYSSMAWVFPCWDLGSGRFSCSRACGVWRPSWFQRRRMPFKYFQFMPCFFSTVFS